MHSVPYHKNSAPLPWIIRLLLYFFAFAFSNRVTTVRQFLNPQDEILGRWREAGVKGFLLVL